MDSEGKYTTAYSLSTHYKHHTLGCGYKVYDMVNIKYIILLLCPLLQQFHTGKKVTAVCHFMNILVYSPSLNSH